MRPAARRAKRRRGVRGWRRKDVRRCGRWRARSDRPASPERRSYRSGRWSRLGRRPPDDRDALEEPFAARLGRHLGVFPQRHMHDAPLDRTHRREQKLAAVFANAISDFTRTLFELFDALALEVLAIELDVLLDLAADQRLVRQHLQRIEQLAVAIDHPPPVRPVEADVDLRLILFRAHREAQLCERKYLFAPGANRGRGLRLRSLLRNVGGELFEIARLQRVGIGSVIELPPPPARPPTPTACVALARVAASTATPAPPHPPTRTTR